MKIYTKSLTEQQSLTKQYYCIDLFKFICALLIVTIHVPPLTSYNTSLNYILINCLARVAVPFYFTASGYFLFRKTSYDNFDAHIPLKYVQKILKLYIIWSIIYFPWILHQKIIGNENGIIYGFANILRNFIFTASYIHLWYLTATIVAILILTYLIKKKFKIKTIVAVSLLMYAVGLLPQTYFIVLEPLRQLDLVWALLKIIQKIISTTRNGLFYGFLFIGIGMLFAYKPILMKFKTAVIGFFVSMLLFFGEAMLVWHLGWAREHDMYIFLVPVTFFMFYLISHIELPKSKWYKYLREMGILIFYMHLFILEILKRCFSILNNTAGINLDNSLLKYCLVILITGTISHFIITLGNTEKFKFLKKIYS